MIFKYTKLTINNVSSLTKRNKREKSFLVRILSSMYKRRMKQWPWHWRTNMKESGRLSWNPLQKNESARNALIFFKCVQRAKKEIRCGLKGSWGWTYILILLPIWSVWNEATGFFFFFHYYYFSLEAIVNSTGISPQQHAPPWQKPIMSLLRLQVEVVLDRLRNRQPEVTSSWHKPNSKLGYSELLTMHKGKAFRRLSHIQRNSYVWFMVGVWGRGDS